MVPLLFHLDCCIVLSSHEVKKEKAYIKNVRGQERLALHMIEVDQAG